MITCRPLIAVNTYTNPSSRRRDRDRAPASGSPPRRRHARGQMPELSPSPTPSKNFSMRRRRSRLATAVLMTWASDPGPAGPMSGRAEIRLVKYSEGIARSLAYCTTGVVPTARSGSYSSIGGDILLEGGPVIDLDTVRLQPLPVFIGPGGFRTGRADVTQIRAGLDQQTTHQQLGALVTGERDACLDRRRPSRAPLIAGSRALRVFARTSSLTPAAAAIAPASAPCRLDPPARSR
jgi:hypothetical protein